MILLFTSHSYSLSELIEKVVEAKLKINDNFINYSGVEDSTQQTLSQHLSQLTIAEKRNFANPISRMLLQLQRQLLHIISDKCTNLGFE